jgi:hypothetical protein
LQDHFENLQSTNWRSMRWKPPSLRVGIEHARRRQQQQLLTPLLLTNTATKSPHRCTHNILRDDHLLYADFEEDEAYQLWSVNSQLKTAQSPVKTNSEISCEEEEEDLQSHGPGWRVEFRPLEIQLTDFENAAHALFVVLLSRCLLAQSGAPGGLNLYMPMSYVEENMRRATLKDAVRSQKFWFPRRPFNTLIGGEGESSVERFHVPQMKEQDLVEMSLDEILNGQRVLSDKTDCIDRPFPGLLSIVYEYAQSLPCDDTHQSFAALKPYLSLLSRRAEGSLPTAARWMRRFVTSHPDYKQDGRVSHRINTVRLFSFLGLCFQVVKSCLFSGPSESVRGSGHGSHTSH